MNEEIDVKAELAEIKEILNRMQEQIKILEEHQAWSEHTYEQPVCDFEHNYYTQSLPNWYNECSVPPLSKCSLEEIQKYWHNK